MSQFVAYVDPGAGSLIVQLVIATIVAVPFFVRSQIRQVLAAVRARLGPRIPEPEDRSDRG